MSAQVEGRVRGKQRGAVAVLVGFVTVAGFLGIGVGVAVAVVAAVGTVGAEQAAVPVKATGVEERSGMVSAVLDGAGLPGKAPVTVSRSGVVNLSMYEGVPTATRVLAAADVWATGIAFGGVALLLVPVLRSTASGDPFARGNARRLAMAAGMVGLGWLAASVLPVVAARAVVAALPAEAGSWEPLFRPQSWPLGFVALLAALACATWHGSRLAADTEGLV